MRVTHLITRLIVGGAQENTVASVLGLAAKPDVQVDLIAGPTTGPEGTLEPMLSAPLPLPGGEGSAPGLLTVLPELVRPLHPWKDVLAWQKLSRLLRERAPDIVHTHSGKAGILGRLAAKRAGVPVIIHTIHGPSFGPFQGALANALFLAAERRAGKVTTHFVTVAHAMTNQYLAAGIGQPSQYTRILSGFDLDPFLTASNDPGLRNQLGIGPHDFVLGKVARLFKLKGHDDLFQIAPALVRRCPNIRFLFVGDGAWRARFENLASQMGLHEHFIFTGLVPPADVPRYVGIMDALVHLSLREGLPRALPQALAAGKPVVAYDCDGACEVCLDNETGFLIRPHDLAGLQERLSTLAQDPALRSRLGERGRALVRGQFSIEKMVDDLHALYQRLLKP